MAARNGRGAAEHQVEPDGELRVQVDVRHVGQRGRDARQVRGVDPLRKVAQAGLVTELREVHLVLHHHEPLDVAAEGVEHLHDLVLGRRRCARSTASANSIGRNESSDVGRIVRLGQQLQHVGVRLQRSRHATRDAAAVLERVVVVQDGERERLQNTRARGCPSSRSSLSWTWL